MNSKVLLLILIALISFTLIADVSAIDSNDFTLSNSGESSVQVTANNLTKYYGNDEPVTCEVKDNESGPVENADVAFEINGKNYSRTTNSSGVANLNINLQSGKYIITSMYNGLGVSNTITIRNI